MPLPTEVRHSAMTRGSTHLTCCSPRFHRDQRGVPAAEDENEIAGDGPFDDALVRKASQLATKRYCAVGGTIELGQGGCDIRFEHRIT